MDSTQKKEGIVIAILAALGLGFLWYKSKNRQTTKPNANGSDTPNGTNGNPTGGGNHLPSLPTQPQIIGSIETVQRDLISGFAANIDDLSKPVELDVYIDGVKKDTLKSNMFRDDIKDTIKTDYGITSPNNQFGFVYHSIIPTGTHKIQVKVKGTDMELQNSPYVSNFVEDTIIVALPRGGGVTTPTPPNNPADNFYTGGTTTPPQNTDTPTATTSGGRKTGFVIEM